MQAIPPFISDVPLPYSFEFFSVSIKGSVSHFFISPVGTTSVCPTYARTGLGTPSSVLEAGWEGNLVLEFANHTNLPIRLYGNSGAAQILFFSGEECEVSYADRKGKYQGQVGITLAKSK